MFNVNNLELEPSLCFFALMKTKGMKLVSVKRQTKREKRYTEKMGMFTTSVIYIKKTFLNIPVKTLHKYRETYYGEVKDCADCRISA